MAGSHGLLTEVTRWSKLVDDKYTYSNFWNFFEESVGPINDGTPEDLSVMDVSADSIKRVGPPTLSDRWCPLVIPHSALP